MFVGFVEGPNVGNRLGKFDGLVDALFDGGKEEICVGCELGMFVGFIEGGSLEETDEGGKVGTIVDVSVGFDVGFKVRIVVSGFLVLGFLLL